MNRRRGELKNITVILILLVFVLLNSGSMLQLIYASEMQKYLFVIFAILTLIIIAKGRKLSIRISYSEAFLALIFIISMLDIFIWNELQVPIFVLYSANLAVFFISFMISSRVDYKTWINTFINLLFVLAIISLVGWLFSRQLLISSYGWLFNRGWTYKSFGIFNIITLVPVRNCGIFWEPGMYQGFLNFAILLLILRKNRTILDKIKIVVFAITVITTFSTTGYALLGILAVIYFYDTLTRIDRSWANLFVLFAVFVFIVTRGFSSIYDLAIKNLPEIVTIKITTQNSSYLDRLYSVFYDFILSIKYPLGVGRLRISEFVNVLAEVYGVDVGARTSTFSVALVHYGIIGGLAYVLLWTRGILYLHKYRIIPSILTMIVMVLILNNEPMMFHLFFATILFYWNRNSYLT